MTFEEAVKLDPDEQAGEIVAGEWKPVTKNTWRHGVIATNVAFLLLSYCRKAGEFSVSSNDPGTRLSREPDTLRGPDVAVVRKERVPDGKGVEGWLDGAPELAVEIAGDSQTTTALLRKAQEYLRSSGEQVWIVVPEEQSVLVVTPPDHVEILGPDDMLTGGELLPGFECAVTDFFEE